MGNFWSNCRKSNLLDSRLQDNQRLLLFENMDDKIEKLEKSMSTQYSNMVVTYNKEINSLRFEINELNKENEKIVRKVNNLNVLINDKETKIANLQHKIYHMESQDEFISTIDSQQLNEPDFVN